MLSQPVKKLEYSLIGASQCITSRNNERLYVYVLLLRNDAGVRVTHVSGAIYKSYTTFQDALKHYHKAYYAGELCVMPKPGGPFWKKSQGSPRGTDIDSTSDISDWFSHKVNLHSQ